jgi:peptidoglycan biosynthesis protein MviN/MurJ (putative lipid II flippase)
MTNLTHFRQFENYILISTILLVLLMIEYNVFRLENLHSSRINHWLRVHICFGIFVQFKFEFFELFKNELQWARVPNWRTHLREGFSSILEVLASDIQELVKMEQNYIKTLKMGPGGTQTCAALAFSYKSCPKLIRARQVSCHVGP